MNQEKRKKESCDEIEHHQMRLTNKKLIGGFLIVASLAIGAYVVWFFVFEGLSLSADPSHWADFATYLSGTVGVAAVVATLLALLKTLVQQQDMIVSQEKQIIRTESQINADKEYRQIERAYQMTMNVLPHLIKSVERNFIEQDFKYYDEPSRALSTLYYGYNAQLTINIHRNGKILFFDYTRTRVLLRRLQSVATHRNENFTYYKDSKSKLFLTQEQRNITSDLNGVFSNKLKMLRNSHELSLIDLSSAFFKVFSHVAKVSNFAADQIKYNEDMKYYIDVCFEDSLFRSKSKDSDDVSKISYLSVLLCYHSFLLGYGAEKTYVDNVNFLKLPSTKSLLIDYKVSNKPEEFSDLLSDWFNIGSLLKNLLTKHID